MATDTKLQLHNINSKAGLCCGSENWIISKRDTDQLGAAEVRFLTPLVGL
jgi:hypothetical protein